MSKGLIALGMNKVMGFARKERNLNHFYFLTYPGTLQDCGLKRKIEKSEGVMLALMTS